MAIQGYPQATICSRIKKNLYIYIFQFLLRQAFADDEASTRLLQILLFLLLSTASLMFIPCAVRSSFTLSIHFFGCLPLDYIYIYIYKSGLYIYMYINIYIYMSLIN